MYQKPVTYGKGSIVPADGKPPRHCRKWRLYVSTGKRPDGKGYGRATRVVYGSKSDANAAMRDFIAELQEGGLGGSQTLRAYSEQWLDTCGKLGEVKPATIKTRRCLLVGVLNLIGGVRLRDVTPQMIERVYVELMDGNTPTGKPLSPTSVHHTHVTLVTMFNRAVATGELKASPMGPVKSPKMSTAEKVPLTAEEVAKVVETTDFSQFDHVAVLLALFCGLRRGEVSALRWGDFQDGWLHVSKSQPTKGDVGTTKTGKARDVRVPGFIASGIERYRMGDDCYLVSRLDGNPVSPTTIYEKWGDRSEELFGKRFTFHVLRHTAVTLLAKENVSVNTAQKMAGHSTSKVTLEVYTHADRKDLEDAAAKLDDKFAHFLHIEE